VPLLVGFDLFDKSTAERVINGVENGLGQALLGLSAVGGVVGRPLFSNQGLIELIAGMTLGALVLVANNMVGRDVVHLRFVVCE